MKDSPRQVKACISQDSHLQVTEALNGGGGIVKVLRNALKCDAAMATYGCHRLPSKQLPWVVCQNSTLLEHPSDTRTLLTASPLAIF